MFKRFALKCVLGLAALAAATNSIQAGFTVTLTAVGLGTTSVSSTLNSASGLSAPAITGGGETVLLQNVGVSNSTGNTLNISSLQVVRTGGPATRQMILTVISNDITYSQGSGNLNISESFITAPSTKLVVTTGTVSNPPAATYTVDPLVNFTPATVPFTLLGVAPRFIQYEFTFELTNASPGNSFVLTDVPGLADNHASVDITNPLATPVPPTALAALIGLPVLGLGRRMIRRRTA